VKVFDFRLDASIDTVDLHTETATIKSTAAKTAVGKLLSLNFSNFLASVQAKFQLFFVAFF
jgi:hypothetical protein